MGVAARVKVRKVKKGGRPKGNKAIDPIIGKRIRQARKQHNPSLTQEELAQYIGVSVTSVRNWEQGQFEPTHENIIEIAKICGVDIRWLKGVDERKLADYTTDELLAEIKRRIEK